MKKERIRCRFGRLAVVVGALGLGALLAPSAALAAPGGTGHTVSITETVHGTFTDPGATNPCTGALGTASFDGNAVTHLTFFPGGAEYWFTFTETGKVTVTWAGVTYTGHATVWANGNWNEKNSNFTFTLTVRLFAPDGSSVVGHQVSHLALNANGVVTVSFDKLSFTCT